MIGIYKITSPTNRVYIGQSIDIEKRWKDYTKDSRTKYQYKLHRSLKKYGYESHTFKIIEECSIELLNERERYYQEFYNCVEKGLNCVYTDTNLKKKVYSKETNERRNSKLRGMKRSQETCNKIRSANLGNKFSDISKNKMRKAKLKIILDISTGIFYEGIEEAAKAFNINKSTLRNKLNGQNINKTNLIYV